MQQIQRVARSNNFRHVIAIINHHTVVLVRVVAHYLNRPAYRVFITSVVSSKLAEIDCACPVNFSGNRATIPLSGRNDGADTCYESLSIHSLHPLINYVPFDTHSMHKLLSALHRYVNRLRLKYKQQSRISLSFSSCLCQSVVIHFYYNNIYLTCLV